ncbi:MAG: hypothetical protein RBU25_06545, partial [Lentisphaeria bacterium]|nr:hypothetical protein [Lentisphaeria bacterium]
SRTEDEHWLPAVLADFAARLAGPVATGLAFGHAFPSCSLPVGAPARLEPAAAGRLQLVTAPRP